MSRSPHHGHFVGLRGGIIKQETTKHLKSIKTMKKVHFFLAAIVAVCLSACVQFKTEAKVDVEVTQDGKPVSGVTVYKFIDKGLGEGSTLYKTNATGSAKTNAAGIAHFDLKSPDDFSPSSVAGSESNTFYFCTYDAEDVRSGIATVTIKTGENKTAKIEIEKLK